MSSKAVKSLRLVWRISLLNIRSSWSTAPSSC